MKILLSLVLIILYDIKTQAEVCSRPIIQKGHVYIYRTTSKINVKVMSCLLYDGSGRHYDVSENCVKAFSSGIYIDRNQVVHRLGQLEPSLTLEEYTTTAYPLKDEIILRSGTICRYSRGFCYDPSVNINYAVVWKVEPVIKHMCPDKLDHIFDGSVDVWTLPTNLTYLLYYDLKLDLSFALRLVDYSVCQNKQLWYIEDNDYVVSFSSLGYQGRATKTANRSVFPLRSKKLVVEAILKDCDLKMAASNFNLQIHAQYFNDPKYLTDILQVYQQIILNNKHNLAALNSRISTMETIIHLNQTVIQHIQMEKSEIPVEKVFVEMLSKNKEFEESLNAVKVGTLDLSEKSKEFSNRMNFLRDAVTFLDVSNKRVEQNIKQFKTETNQKIFNLFDFGKNRFNDIIRLENLIRTLDFKIEFVRQNTSNYILNTFKFNQGTNILIDQLQSDNLLLAHNIENINLHLLKLENSSTTKIPANFTNALEKVLQIEKTINQKIEDVAKLKRGIEMIIVAFNKKYIELNDTVIKKVNMVDNKVLNLTNLFNLYKKDLHICNTTLNGTEPSDSNGKTNIDMSIINNTISSKINNIQTILTEQIKTLSKELSDLKKEFGEIVEQIARQEAERLKQLENKLTTNTERIYSKFNDTEAKFNQSAAELYRKITDLVNNAEKRINSNMQKAKASILQEVRLYADDSLVKKKTFDEEMEKIKQYVNISLNDIQQNSTHKSHLEYIKENVEFINNTIKNKVDIYEDKFQKLENNMKIMSEDLDKSITDKIEAALLPYKNSSTVSDKKLLDVEKSTSQKLSDLKFELENSTKTENNNLLNKIDTPDTKIIQAENNIAKQNMISQKIDKILDDIRQDKSSLNNQLKTQQNAINNLQNEIADLDQKISNNTDINNNLDSINKTLAKNIEDLQQEVKKIEAKVDGANSNKLRRLSEAEDKIKTNFEEQLTKISNLNAEIDTIKTDMQNKNLESNKAEAEIDILKDNITKCSIKQKESDHEIDNLKKEIHQMKNDFKQKEETFTNSLLNVQTMLEKKNEEIAEIKAELGKLMTCCTENKNGIKDKETEINKLREEFTKANKELKEKQEKLATTLHDALEEADIVQPDIQ
ncbi:putative leucine-rich repeat-containing protein DDB_G0290503 [Diabrotica virgifera virgifera]|uniref:Leucine-rich repeat-containing protein DDB_G0290503 n=1 Tax=Diabrotica virgifera virgifera TaxID=50390 RepID=A0ABM5KQ73_DIAVI|nr:putative leucine-rich repeat-containing protein DDB_G0290503 [Diabrotica virgifera virgifera]